jgi:hypothetical protein
MKSFEYSLSSAPLARVIDVIAEALGRREPGSPNKSRFARMASRFWHRQLRGVDAYIARADSMFAALDKWLWKQRVRETEAWLAQSKDLFELEARIRELDRAPNGRIF